MTKLLFRKAFKYFNEPTGLIVLGVQKQLYDIFLKKKILLSRDPYFNFNKNQNRLGIISKPINLHFLESKKNVEVVYFCSKIGTGFYNNQIKSFLH